MRQAPPGCSAIAIWLAQPSQRSARGTSQKYSVGQAGDAKRTTAAAPARIAQHCIFGKEITISSLAILVAVETEAMTFGRRRRFHDIARRRHPGRRGVRDALAVASKNFARSADLGDAT